MSAAVSSRRVDHRELTFSFAPRTHNNNLLLFDVETHSLWSQLDQKAIRGTLTGTPLETLPTIQTSWEHWRSLYPETSVVTHQENQPPPFRYPRAVQTATNARVSSPDRLASDRLVLGVVLEDNAKMYSFSELAKTATPVVDRVGQHEILVHYYEPVPAAWITDRKGNLLPSITTLWFGWSGFYPDTDVFRGKQ